MKKTKKLVMSWLLAFCCVITLVAPSVVNAAADDFEIIDDTDARFVYSTEQNWSFTVKKLQIMQCSA